MAPLSQPVTAQAGSTAIAQSDRPSGRTPRALRDGHPSPDDDSEAAQGVAVGESEPGWRLGESDPRRAADGQTMRCRIVNHRRRHGAGRARTRGRYPKDLASSGLPIRMLRRAPRHVYGAGSMSARRCPQWRADGNMPRQQRRARTKVRALLHTRGQPSPVVFLRVRRFGFASGSTVASTTGSAVEAAATAALPRFS